MHIFAMKSSKARSIRRGGGYKLAAIVLSCFILFLTASCRNNSYPIILPPLADMNAGPSGILSGGNGTVRSPYQVGSSSDLSDLAELVNNGTLSQPYYYELSGDITIDDEAWEPIGRAAGTSSGEVTGTPFTGIFEGNGNTITINVSSMAGDAAAGIFGAVAGEDTVLRNFSVDGKLKTDSGYAGLVAGILTDGAVVEGVTTLPTAVIESSGDAAGFVGRIYGSGTIRNSENNASVIATGSGSRAGGFINLSKFPEYDGAIILSNLVNKGDITGTNGGTGGIAGDIVGTNADHLYNEGDVSGQGMVGGIAGGIEGGSSVQNAENKGTVKLAVSDGAVRNIGGIIGRISGADHVTLSDVKNNGLFDFSDAGEFSHSYIGGIVASSYSPLTITDAENNAVINAAGSNSVGGIIGATEESSGNYYELVINGNTKNNASITGHDNVGGIAGTASRAEIIGAGNGEDVTITGANGVGGIVGRFIYEADSVISNSPNTAVIAVSPGLSSADSFGGIAGSITAGSLRIESSSNSGTFDFSNVPVLDDPTSNTSLQHNKGYGGIVGSAANSSLTIEDSDNHADLLCNEYAKSIGGIIGLFSGAEDSSLRISSSHNSGEVSGYMNIGGIAGTVSKAVLDISSAVNDGDVSGNYSAGGIIGSVFSSSGSVDESSNSGDISYGPPEGKGQVGIGGFIGYLAATENLAVSGGSSTGNINGVTSWSHSGAFLGRCETGTCAFTDCFANNMDLPDGIGFHGTDVTGCTFFGCSLNGADVS